MMMREGTSPSTKADLAALGETLRSELAGLGKDLRSEMAELGKDLRSEMADLGKELRTEMADLGKELRTEMRDGYLRLAVQIERQQNEARVSEDRVMGRIGDLNSQILRTLDAFAGKAQNSERAMVLHGRELTEVSVGLKDHERRISVLESRTDS